MGTKIKVLEEIIAIKIVFYSVYDPDHYPERSRFNSVSKYISLDKHYPDIVHSLNIKSLITCHIHMYCLSLCFFSIALLKKDSTQCELYMWSMLKRQWPKPCAFATNKRVILYINTLNSQDIRFQTLK